MNEIEWEKSLLKFLRDTPKPACGIRLMRALGIVEEHLCMWALETTDTKVAAANKLGLLRTTYVEKLKRWSGGSLWA